MQKISLLTIGSLKEQWAKEGCAMYEERLSYDVDFHMLELFASKERDPKRQAAEESARLLTHARTLKGDIWVLDERGKQMTSQTFAKEVEAMKDLGTPLVFILGGAYGLTDDVRTSAKRVLALSAMTLPHELCRVVFLEQLYRALSINRGTGYHH